MQRSCDKCVVRCIHIVGNASSLKFCKRSRCSRSEHHEKHALCCDSIIQFSTRVNHVRPIDLNLVCAPEIMVDVSYLVSDRDQLHPARAKQPFLSEGDCTLLFQRIGTCKKSPQTLTSVSSNSAFHAHHTNSHVIATFAQMPLARWRLYFLALVSSPAA